jgi:hypothetical protein
MFPVRNMALDIPKVCSDVINFHVPGNDIPANDEISNIIFNLVESTTLPIELPMEKIEKEFSKKIISDALRFHNMKSKMPRDRVLDILREFVIMRPVMDA